MQSFLTSKLVAFSEGGWLLIHMSGFRHNIFVNRGVELLKKEYDFSKGERGKFYHPDAELNFPIYLEPDIADFIRNPAVNKNNKEKIYYGKRKNIR